METGCLVIVVSDSEELSFVENEDIWVRKMFNGLIHLGLDIFKFQNFDELLESEKLQRLDIYKMIEMDVDEFSTQNQNISSKLKVVSQKSFPP